MSRSPATRGRRAGAWVWAVGVLASLPTQALAQPQPELAPARTPEDLWQPKASALTGVRLEPKPGFSLGLGAYGGLALLMTRDGRHPHTLAGLLSRARYGYFELGAVLELTDQAPEQWRSVGGFVGAWLPYRNWVDFELAAGIAVRRHLNASPRYGPGGYDLQSPAFTLRLGVSDRTSESLFGARLGGELVAALDLEKREAEWEYQLGSDADPGVVRGITPVSGFSLGLVLSTGFDVAFKRRADSPTLTGADARRTSRF